MPAPTRRERRPAAVGNQGRGQDAHATAGEDAGPTQRLNESTVKVLPYRITSPLVSRAKGRTSRPNTYTMAMELAARAKVPR